MIALKFIRQRVPLICALLSASAASAALETYNFTVGSNIADNTDPGASFMQSIGDSTIGFLTEVRVGLHLVGSPGDEGFAGDLFVSLIQTSVGGTPSPLSPTSVLLNQVGGGLAPYDGWNVTFRDDAAQNVGNATRTTGVLTGDWRPHQTALSAFNGGAGNGDWWLNVTDMELGGTMRLEGWSLTLIGDELFPIPEPVNVALGVFVAGALCVHGVRRWRAPLIR